MADIQLLVTDDANRRALASLVDDRHTIITDTEFQQADLYLVDDASLPRYREALEARKRDSSPVFCPVVLIRRDRTSVTIDLPTPEPNKRSMLINDVMTAPVERQALFRRTANLLARRRQTRELQEKTERLERFASTLRHELRNPLNVLDGWLDVARDRGDASAFDRCQTAIDRMERLLNDTMVILEGEYTAIDRDTVELADLCEECWEMVPESDARLAVRTSQQLSADEGRLSQLLGNLFRNAVEHGGENVALTVGDLDDGFYVEDDGPGVPEEERGSVFEEGYTTSGSGSGLGLAVVREVAASHGWDVRVTDGNDGGARFEITGIERSMTSEASEPTESVETD